MGVKMMFPLSNCISNDNDHSRGGSELLNIILLNNSEVV